MSPVAGVIQMDKNKGGVLQQLLLAVWLWWILSQLISPTTGLDIIVVFLTSGFARRYHI